MLGVLVQNRAQTFQSCSSTSELKYKIAALYVGLDTAYVSFLPDSRRSDPQTVKTTVAFPKASRLSVSHCVLQITVYRSYFN